MIKKYLLNLDGFKTYRMLWINRLFLAIALLFTFSEIYTKTVLIFIFFLWITVIKRADFLRIIKQPIIIWLFLLVLAITLFPLTISHDHKYALKFLERLSFYLLIPIIMIATSIRRDYVIKMVTAFIFGLVLNELISYGILFGLWLHPVDGYPVYFMHHVYYSVLLSFVEMLLIYRLLHQKKIVVKILTLIFIMTMFGNLVISGGRTGQITLFITFIATFLIYKKVNWKSIASVFLLPIVAIFVTYMIYTPFQERMKLFVDDTKTAFYNKNYDTSFGNRIFAYVITAKRLEVENVTTILFGGGIDNSIKQKNELIQHYFPTTKNMQMDTMQFHSSYVDIVWWSGLVGLSFLIMFFISILRIKILDDEMRYIKVALFFTLVLANLPDMTIENQYIMIMTAIFVGLFLAQEYHELKIMTKREQ